jgi:hypothetical protein
MAKVQLSSIQQRHLKRGLRFNINKDITTIRDLNTLEDTILELKDAIANLKLQKGDKGDVGESIIGDVGPRGERGEKGDSIVGPKGEMGLSGKDGRDGRDGRDGLDSDEIKIIESVLQKIPKPKDGIDGIDGKDAVVQDEYITKILDPHIKTLHTNIARAIDGMPRGSNYGGFIETQLKAGNNVTISKDATGAWVIASTGGGGGGVTQITAGTGISISPSGGTGNVTVTATGAGIVQNIEFIVDGGGSLLTSGSKGYLEIPFACTINQVTILGDQSGTIAVDIKKCTYSGFPTDSSIVASAPPTLSSAQKNQDSTLTGWTTSISAGDILKYVVLGSPSIASVQRVTISLKVTRT